MSNEPSALNCTIIIPTYNGAKRLPALLEKLKAQTGTEGISWEVIVIDNNSSDNTREVVEQYQTTWPKEYPLRYCFEPKQGLAFARQRGIEEANGDFVGFLDDDMLPAPDWVKEAYLFGKNHPKAGAWGSQVHPDYEVEPPKNFWRIQAFLAITERGQKERLYLPAKRILPPGGGLVVRRNIWVECVPKVLIFSGAYGAKRAIGQDIEAVLFIQRAKYEIWYNSKMQLFHRIPSQRLKKEYLTKLFFQIGLTRWTYRRLRFSRWQAPFVFFLGLLNGLVKLMTHLLKYRSAVLTDTVTACELWLLIGALFSPFYSFMLRFKKEKIKS